MSPIPIPEIKSVLSDLSEVRPTTTDTTDKTDKTSGPTPCPRCGAEVHPLVDLAKLARQTSGRAADALHALETRRLALPSIVPVALQEAHLDGRILAARLSCHAGTCAVPERAPTQAPPAEQATGPQPPTTERNHHG